METLRLWALLGTLVLVFGGCGPTAAKGPGGGTPADKGTAPGDGGAGATDGGGCPAAGCQANAHCATGGTCVCNPGYASQGGSCVANLPTQSNLFQVGVTTSMDKVYFQKPYDFTGVMGGDATVRLARNEYEATQVVVFPTAALTGLQVTVADLVDPAGDTLPSADVAVNVIGYVNLTATKIAGDRVGWQPDPLLPAQPVDLSANTPQPWLVTVHATASQAAGTYTGWITFAGKDAGGASAQREVKLTVEVWSYTLPRTGKFQDAMICGWGLPHAMWPSQPFTNAQKKAKMLQIADLGFRNRLPPVACLANGLSSWDWNGQGNTTYGYPIYDGTRFDATRTGALIDDMIAKGANNFWIGLTSNIYKLPAKVAARKAALKTYLTDYTAYLKKRGLLGDAYIYGVDEPWGSDVTDAKNTYTFVKSVAPDLRFLQNTNQNNDTIIPQLLGYFDALDINLGWYDVTKVGSYRKQHPTELDDLWWNLNIWPATEPNLFVEYPLVDARIVGPMSFKFDVQGFEYWSMFTTLGIGSYHPVKANELHVKWDVDDHSLDGTLVYPGADGSVYSSLRFESFRDGIEDLEALYLLQAKDPTSPLLRVPIVTDLGTFEHDPKKILAFRAKVAAALTAP